MHNLDEVAEFIETHNREILNHEEKEDMNRPITSKEIESITKTPLTK